MVELGQIQKPEAAEFSGKRKLYCIASVYPVEGAPEEYKELVGKYWDEVLSQIEKIETAGKAKKIFCELIPEGKEEVIDFLNKINEGLYRLVRKKLDEGGELVPLESEEIFGPYTDWSNCLRVVFTREVFAKVMEFYTELAEKRSRHILELIEKKLAGSEAGLLIMKDEDRAKMQFPKDIEVFLITPPSYDDIMRWLRDRFAGKQSLDRVARIV